MADVCEIFVSNTSHAYHFKIALQRLWDLNDSIAESYLMKWISWALRSRMPDFIRLGKTLKRHIDGILEAIGSGINSVNAGQDWCKIAGIKLIHPI